MTKTAFFLNCFEPLYVVNVINENMLNLHSAPSLYSYHSDLDKRHGWASEKSSLALPWGGGGMWGGA